MIRAPLSRLVRAWLLTGVVDGLFACVMSVIYSGSVTRVWQGVASTLLGIWKAMQISPNEALS